MKDGSQAKALKAAKTKEEPSNKKVKETVTNPTKNKICRLIGHNHHWKDCPNNPNSKKYNGTHYSKNCELNQTAAERSIITSHAAELIVSIPTVATAALR